MKKFGVIVLIVMVTTTLVMCRKAVQFGEDGFDERLSGGIATVFDETSKAFTHPFPGLDENSMRVHELGDAAFEQTFVSAPAALFGGLGPVFNNVSCVSCHHNDGKGTPTAGSITSSLLFRISSNGTTEFGGPSGVEGYGNQVQDVSLFGISPEAHMSIGYTDLPVNYPDGTTVHLRSPSYTMQNAYMQVNSAYSLSPRLAPPVFGLGLLENIPEATLLFFADENDADGDGISGRANYVYSPQTKKKEIGRFGLKANTSSLFVQVATAYQQDMGITSTLHPHESCYGQSQADPYSDDPELPDSILQATVFYVRSLAVPARRDVTDAVVRRGQQLFASLNCSGCHKPTIQTGTDLSFPAISNQRIHPYTDLLLHDMGDGLADSYGDFLATGKEWRTTPLWGIGLFEKTNGTPFYLHDGRARTIEEAILWHGGEALQSKNDFVQMNKPDRDALIRFLRSL